MIYAFDFEWTNKTIMYGSYERTHSVFQNSDDDGGRQAVARRARSARAVPRPGAGRGVRRAVRAAGLRRLGPGPRAAAQGERSFCSEAGFAIKDGKRVLPNGEPHRHRIPDRRAVFQPHHMPFIKNLGALGIEATLRMVDAVQYRSARDDFDFDIDGAALQLFLTPGDSLRSYFSSQAAAIKGSQNLAGIADPVIDALIERIIAAQDSRRSWSPPARRSTACSAPAATGSRIGTRPRTGSPIGTCSAAPRQKPRYARGIPETWWYDRR